MAKMIYSDPKVGQRVYVSYSPKQAGVIIEIIGPNKVKRLDGSEVVTCFHDVRVKWVNGTEGKTTTHGLADFDALIEDHKKKLLTHQVTLAKLEALAI